MTLLSESNALSQGRFLIQRPGGEGPLDVLVIGGLNVDFFIKGPKLPTSNESILGHSFLQALGGKGANQAVASHRLGAKTVFAGKIGGGPTGQFALQALQQAGLPGDYLLQDENSVTGAALIHVDEKGQKQNMVDPGANLKFTPDDVISLLPLMQKSKVLLLQLEIPLESVMKAIDLKSQMPPESRGRILLDVAPPQKLPDQLLTRVDILRANADEACLLTGIDVQDASSARKAASQLLQRGCACVLIEARQDGNLLVSAQEGEQLFPRHDVKALDTTGAGDALMGTLAAMLAQEKSLKQACTMATAAAALSTTQLGAQSALPSRQELENFLKEH